MNVNYNLFLWIKYLSTKFSFIKLMVPMDELFLFLTFVWFKYATYVACNLI